MRLKSLELIGYKTFALKTEFEFGEKITAIVGPNGSGKSNIADALRWVLGEQSYNLLRGKKTEDMIFSGSEQRSRSGMASASVLFDNTEEWLPIDFTDVSITRRATRDGQNEYLVNNQRSLKPDERRKLFEEAAGIGLYRSRREESLGRLDATQRNIERVRDILAELKPRISTLKRQSRRAIMSSVPTKAKSVKN